VNGVETATAKNSTSCSKPNAVSTPFLRTGAPDVFLANVQGPWIHPDAMEVERVVEVAHACPSGAIQYRRTDGVHDETAPPVNLASIREAGPYAFRGQLELDGDPIGFRATLCRCGASKNKPFCDSSHHEVGFNATGEPASGKTDALAARNGVLAIDPQLNGPLSIRGNLEITSGTGRIVSRVTTAKRVDAVAAPRSRFVTEPMRALDSNQPRARNKTPIGYGAVATGRAPRDPCWSAKRRESTYASGNRPTDNQTNNKKNTPLPA